MNKLKTLSIITLVLMILPALSAMFATQAIAATPSIETSADSHGGYFNNNTWVEVKVVDSSRAGQQNITVNLYVNGDFVNTTTLKAVGTSGVFMGYIVYNNTNVAPPANPVISNEIYLKDLGVTLSAGDKLTIEYVGPGGTVTDTLTFNQYKAEINLDRTTVPPWNNTVIYVYIEDQDFNYDPTSKDTITNYNLTVTIYDALGNEFIGNFTGSKKIQVNLTETGSNTAVFAGELKLQEIINALGNNTAPSVNNTQKLIEREAYDGNITQYMINQTYLNDYDNSGNLIAPFDHLEIENQDGGSVNLHFFTSNAELEEPTAETTISLETELHIMVNDPDMNLDTGSKDTYGIYVNNTFIQLEETGANTGEFEATVPITYTSGATHVTPTEIYVNKPSLLNIRLEELTTQLPTAIISIQMTSYKPILNVSKTTALPIESVKLTLTDHDLNDKGNNAPDTFGFAFSSGTDFKYRPSVNSQGIFMVLVNGKLVKAFTNGFMLFQETSPGVFEATFNLNWIGGMNTLKNGDNVTFVWEDLYNGVNATASINITKPSVAISLDRSVYPMPNNGEFKLYVDVYDPYANTIPTVAETIPASDVRIIVTKAGTNEVLLNKTLDSAFGVTDLVETGLNTGVFEARVTVDLNSLNSTIHGVANYTGATIKVIYKNGLAEDTATIKPSTAVLTVNGTNSITVNEGDKITVTLVEPDANVDSAAKDTVNVTINGDTKTLTETGVNTGVFTGTFTVGFNQDINVPPTAQFNIEYNDLYTSATTILAAASASLSTSVKVASHTAQILVLPAPINGVVTLVAKTGAVEKNATITFRIHDPDLVLNSSTTLLVRGSIDEETLNLTQVQGKPYCFNITIPVILNATGSPGDHVLEIPNSTGEDTLVLRYTDNYAASGQGQVLTEFVKVKVTKEWVGHNGELYVYPEKPYYLDGDQLTIYLYDPDPGTTSPTVTLTSWRMVNGKLQRLDPLSLSITLQSNGSKGWYIGYYTIKTHNLQLFYELGDYLKLTYKDKIAANGSDVVTAEKLLPIGYVTATPVQPPAPENVTFKSTSGAPVTPKVGVPMLVDIPVKNKATSPVTVDIILLVYTPDGVPVGISYGRISLPAASSSHALVGWVPTERGTFHIKVFFWDLANKKPLSEQPLEFNVTVE